MDVKSKVTAEEWEILKFAVLWIFNAVANADGVIDKKESMAIKRVLELHSQIPGSIAKILLQEVSNDWSATLKNAMADKRGYMRGIAETVRILDLSYDKFTATQFKKVLLAIGFYIGNVSADESGKRLSPEELKAIGLLAGLLKISKEDMNNTPTVSEIMAIFAME